MRHLAARLCPCSRCECCADYLHGRFMCLLCIVGLHGHPVARIEIEKGEVIRS